MMDYPGAGDYDVNTPFKYEEDEPPSDGVEDNRPHTQDDLLYTPLDFAHGDVPSTSTSNSHSNMMDTQPSIDLVTSSSNGTSHILGNNVTTDSVVMETNDAVPMETNAPSSPESDEIPLAARTRTRPSRSTRSKKSFAEVNEEEDEEVFETKPPKGININLYEITTPLVGTQSIFRSDVQKERRANLTKGSKKKKKKEPEFCRFCFTNELTLTKIRSAKLPPSSSHPNTKLTTLVPAVSEVELCLSEKWTNPSFQLVCDDCVLVFSQFYEFRQAVQTNDVLLRRLYCSSKAKSKKLPTTPTSAPVTPTPKGRGRPPKVREISSDDESDAKSTVSTKSNKKKARGKRKGVTDDEETDGYLSSVSKTSRKSTTSRKGGKKKKGGVTSDEETDGYMSSVSKKSTNTGSAAKSKKKRRYNSDSDNEDVKSDVSDGMDYAPTAYDSDDATKWEKDTNEVRSSMYNDYALYDLEQEDEVSNEIRNSRVGRIREHSDKMIGMDAKNSLYKVEIKNNFSNMDNNGSEDISKNESRKLSSSVINLGYRCDEIGTNKAKSRPNRKRREGIKNKISAHRESDYYDNDSDDSEHGPQREVDKDYNIDKRDNTDYSEDDTDEEYSMDASGENKNSSNSNKESINEEIKKTSGGRITRSEEEKTLKEIVNRIVYAEKKRIQRKQNTKGRKCELCSVQFRLPISLTNHMRNVHNIGEIVKKERKTKEESILCNYCAKTFTKVAYLRKHIQCCHQERQYTVCHICARKVKSISLHMRVHKDAKYICHVCQKRFRHGQDLKAHKMAVHGLVKPEEMWPCEYCDKQFVLKNYLRKHMRTHTQEKLYFCECGQGFTYNTSLRSHKQTCVEFSNLNYPAT